MVTLKEIAQHCGVSVTTVSNIVNNSPKRSGMRHVKSNGSDRGTWVSSNYFAQGCADSALRQLVLSLRISRSLRRRRLSKAL